MKIYDISQEVLGCEVFPGDPRPELVPLRRMDEGALYNLSAFRMCAHNGTHIDAPLHFLKDGKSVGRMDPDRFVGYAFVAAHEGPLLAADAERILKAAAERNPGAAERILIKGRATVTAEAAKVFAARKIKLLGNESQTVGPEDAPMEVHLILLGAEIVLLEGIRLADVDEGIYILHAAPLNLGSAEGAPCRATLIRPEEAFADYASRGKEERAESRENE